MSKTGSLIEELEGRHEPVKPLAHPLRRILPWGLFAVIYMCAAVLLVGVRHDIELKMQDMSFLFETGLALMIAVTAAMASSWLCVPDMRGQKILLVLPVVLLSVFAFFYTLLLANGAEGYTLQMAHTACTMDGILFGSLPALALVYASRKGATTRPYWLSFMNILSVGALGIAALRFTCGADSSLHVAVYHFLPFIVLGILLGMLARRVYDW